MITHTQINKTVSAHRATGVCFVARIGKGFRSKTGELLQTVHLDARHGDRSVTRGFSMRSLNQHPEGASAWLEQEMQHTEAHLGVKSE